MNQQKKKIIAATSAYWLFNLTPLLTGLASNLTYAQDNPTSVGMISATLTGSGCPEGSFQTQLTDDGEVVSMIFDEYLLESNSDSSGTVRTGCQIKLMLQVDKEWTYGIFASGLEGYAFLEEGVKATQQTQYFFEPSGKMVVMKPLRLQGAYDDTFDRAEALSLNEVRFAPCLPWPHAINIDTSMTIQGNGAFGHIATDTLSGGLSRNLGIVYKPCRPKPDQAKSIAVCNASLVHRVTGKVKGNVLSQGKGKTAQQAEQRAKQKLDRKCSNKKMKKPQFQCQAQSCQSFAL